MFEHESNMFRFGRRKDDSLNWNRTHHSRLIYLLPTFYVFLLRSFSLSHSDSPRLSQVYLTHLDLNKNTQNRNFVVSFCYSIVLCVCVVSTLFYSFSWLYLHILCAFTCSQYLVAIFKRFVCLIRFGILLRKIFYANRLRSQTIKRLWFQVNKSSRTIELRVRKVDTEHMQLA